MFLGMFLNYVSQIMDMVFLNNISRKITRFKSQK